MPPEACKPYRAPNADAERLLTSWALCLADNFHPGPAVAHAERLSTSRRRTPPAGHDRGGAGDRERLWHGRLRRQHPRLSASHPARILRADRVSLRRDLGGEV